MTSASQTSNALPLYVQISELLIRDIAAGRLIDGERLPPERDMAEELGISIGTLRKALADLTKKGLLERIQGSGNYIRQGGTQESVYAMFRLELLSGGGLPRADVLDVERVRKPEVLPAFGTSDQGTRIRRLRYLNDIIIAVEEIWLDGDSGTVKKEMLSESLYRYYQKNLGFWIVRAEDRVTIDEVPSWAPDVFSKQPGTVTGYIERFSWADRPKPVEFSRTWFDTDRAHYVQRLK
ncbi:MAG: GntR family transcriptional regulator [Roseibium sp.]|uniref:GntR family transcriptional regulator n=1 Tax=Roseibium sp. TaxID=1936156 RepID=UPI001AFF90C5|nr:GntR family transcriptional regulator [Roseibium sp.]MBO6895557.1 GntR family transcriptional regulator [Roseibium sp.]MBO6931712.1 GntR family transcriptional regulator [Roseibium sp.]